MRTIQAAQTVAVKHPVRPEERPKKRHNLRVIDENSRRVSTSRRAASSIEIPFPLFVLSVSALTACIILNVAQQALVSQLSYQTEMVKKEIQIAQQEQDKLLARKANLESPQRIESVAINKLSMVKAPKISYLRVAVGGPEPAYDNNPAEQ
ncbi:MAG TPA: hypothetical protein DE036_06640 [Actinobacteria bacterium]|nr:hypothetical protein [Actinomycetota bacterium]